MSDEELARIRALCDAGVGGNLTIHDVRRLLDYIEELRK